MARAAGRCLVTPVNPSRKDVNRTNKLNHASSNEPLGRGNTKHKEQRGENTLILMEQQYRVTEGGVHRTAQNTKSTLEVDVSLSKVAAG